MVALNPVWRVERYSKKAGAEGRSRRLTALPESKCFKKGKNA